MKKLTLLLTFCIIGLTASAQFWKKKRKPQPELVLQQMPLLVNIPAAAAPVKAVFYQELPESEYMEYLAEQSMIKEAKHKYAF